MQHPSLQNVRIRSTRDALQVFYAVARSLIPLITRRLDAKERRSIVPGNVYVWEERSANSDATSLGMKRWTDGIGWGPSQDFLFYHQKECDVSGDPTSASTPWAQMISMYPSPRARAVGESECLIKQTYSVRVSLPDDRLRGIFRKWHLTAYFSEQRLGQLDTIDDVQGIGDVPVPDGWFHHGKSRRDNDLPKSVVAKCIPQAPMEGVISTSDSVQPSFYPSQFPAPIYTQFPMSANASQLELSEAPGARETTPSLPPSVEHPHYTSSGIRQTTCSGPNLIAGRDHARFRDSYAGHASFNCPSPPSSSSSMLVTPSPRIHPVHLPEKLVPLDYLQNISRLRRDPIDEQFLQRFSMT